MVAYIDYVYIIIYIYFYIPLLYLCIYVTCVIICIYLHVYTSYSCLPPFLPCFWAQVYRLFTLPQSEDLDDLLQILDASASAKVRCAGVLYVRFVVPPHKLWEKLEENLFDEQELKYLDGDKQVTTTIQEYVENLLIKDKYYNTPLPRIPVKVRQQLEQELAPLAQFRKRMAAMQKALPKKVSGTAVEVYVDGTWLRGHIKHYLGNHKRKVGVLLENGSMVNSHLGKVVLRDEDEAKGETEDEKKEDEHPEKVDKGSEKKEKKEKTETKKESRDDRSSRSRSRHRSRSRTSRRRSPDWARYKGPILDASELERLREKAREDAVVGVGKVYSKRPTTVEGELWRGSGDARVSMLGPQHVGGNTSRSSTKHGVSDPEVSRTRSREEEEEHKRRMREIYEKLGVEVVLNIFCCLFFQFGNPSFEDVQSECLIFPQNYYYILAGGILIYLETYVRIVNIQWSERTVFFWSGPSVNQWLLVAVDWVGGSQPLEHQANSRCQVNCSSLNDNIFVNVSQSMGIEPEITFI